MRGAAFGIPEACTPQIFILLEEHVQQLLLHAATGPAISEEVPIARAAALKAVAQMATIPKILEDSGDLHLSSLITSDYKGIARPL